MFHKNSLIAWLFLLPISAFSQFEILEKVEKNDNPYIIPYTKYKLLSNDLTLIIHEDHSDPIAHVQVSYHVGSARESVRNSGFAHFFEHMMFQGSKNVEDEEHFKIISEAGGTNNAFTSFDKTVYFETAPSNLTETMLWLEADRMGTHLEGFTEKKFNNQRDAVKNEKRQRYDNQPYGMLNEELFKTLFANHPYEWTPIGFVDDLDIASFNDLKNFFLRWYGPNNAILTVSGDVNPEEVKQWVSKYFGGIQKGPEVRKQRAPRPILPNNQYREIKDNIFLPLNVYAYPTVPVYHKDEPALDILSYIIGGSNNSILYKNLVKTKDAVQASCSHFSLELSGVFSINVVSSYNGLSRSEIEEKVMACFEEFEKNGIPEDALKMAKNSFRAGYISSLESISGRSLIIADWNTLLNKKWNGEDEINRYKNVTNEDILNAYKRYIKGKKFVNISVVRDNNIQEDGKKEKSKSINPHAGEAKKTDPQYLNLTYNPPKDNFDRSIRPEIKMQAEGSVLSVPNYYTQTFENGLQLIGAESNEVPMVYVSLDIEGGHLLEDGKKVKTGVSALTSYMMGEGTKKLSTEEFSKQIDLLGANLYYSSGSTQSGAFLSCPIENFDAALRLFKESLFNPRFDEEDFERVKNQALESVKTQKTSPNTMANKAFNKLIWGKNTLGTYYTGTYKDIKKVTLNDVKEFYKKYYSPNISRMIVVGNIAQDVALSKLNFFSNWKNTNVTIPNTGKQIQPEKTKIYLIDKPYAAQSRIVAGFPAPKFDYNGEHFKCDMMNFSLGGAFNSRINLNLREDKGYTYGARAGFNGNKEYGIYRFSSDVKKRATDSSIVELVKEITNFRNNGITDEELRFTKKALILSEALNYETPFKKLNFLNSILEYDMPKNYPSIQKQIVENISKSEINKAAKEYLKPENMIIVVVGHAYKIKPSLEKLGFEIVEMEVE